MDPKIKTYKRNSSFANIKDFSPGYLNDGDFIEVTEWVNKDGFDININRTSISGINIGGTVNLQLTCGEFTALEECIKSLYEK